MAPYFVVSKHVFKSRLKHNSSVIFTIQVFDRVDRIVLTTVLFNIETTRILYCVRKHHEIEILNVSLVNDLRKITRTIYEIVIVTVGQSQSVLKCFLLTTAALICY